ncbi:MAG: hypothetical protein IDH49_14240 [Gammaproteobacteria bacterium]|nr:hypothetical protein [Gammaproteobacteria bacterium]
MNSIQSTSSSTGDYEATVRDMIKHENELMNHRITWLSTLHGLLFAALGFAWEKSDAQVLVFIFSVLGIVISISSITVLRAASGAISDLADWWENEKPEGYQGPGVIGRRTTKSWQKLFYPWNLLPVLFTFAWLFVLGVNWCRANA